MNERIEELAREAGFKHPDHVGLCEEYAYFDHMKFAELIVGECVDKIGENFVGAVGTHASAHNSAVLKCQKIIKQHFGVEE